MKNLKTRLSLLLAFVLSFALFVGFQSVSADNAVEDAKASVLTYEGMLARTAGNSGIRSMFRIDKAALKTLEENGYTVEIGASMGTSYFDGTKYNEVSDLTVTADAEKGYVTTAEKAVAVVVYSSTGADYATNKYAVLNANEYKFAFTTLFSEDFENATYYNAEFCYRGFVALTKDGETDAEIIYVDADGANFGNSISLYEIVDYFVSGGYTGEKAEEYASLPKFHEIACKAGITISAATEYDPAKQIGGFQNKGSVETLVNGNGTDDTSDDITYRLIHKKVGNTATKDDELYIYTPGYTAEGFYEFTFHFYNANQRLELISLISNCNAFDAAKQKLCNFTAKAQGTVPATVDYVPTASNQTTATFTMYCKAGVNSLYFYIPNMSNSSMSITGIDMRLVKKTGGAEDLTLIDTMWKNASGLWVGEPDNADRTAYSLTVEKDGMYNVGAWLGSAVSNTYTVTFTDENGTATVLEKTASASDYNAGYPDGGVYVDSLGKVYLAAGTYTVSFASTAKSHLRVIAVEYARDAATTFEYFPKDNEAAAGSLLSDGETLHVTTTAHNFNVNVDRAGIYGVKMKYNSKNQRVGYVKLANATYPNVKESEGRILENILTYEATPADYVVPDAHKTGAYQPDPENATMESRYFGGDFLYIYLGAGENALSIYTASGSSGTLEFGLYAMQFTLIEPLSLDDRITQSEFFYGETTTPYKAKSIGPRGDRNDTKYVKGEITVDHSGVYSLSGLVIVGPQTTMTVEFTDADGKTVANLAFQWTNGTYAYAQQTSTSYRYKSFGEVSLPAGAYSVKISMDENSPWYIGFSELYLTKVSAIPEAIDTPVVTVVDGVASWEAVKGATAYAYKVNGGEAQTTTATSVTLANVGDAITVQAIGNGKEYLDSAWSEVKTYHVTVFDIDFDTDITASVGLTKETEGDYAGRYLLATGSSNYFEFKVTPTVSGLYAISYDSVAVTRVRAYHKNMTDKGDGWATHAATAQIQPRTTSLDVVVAHQYLYAGEENTIRVYLEGGAFYISSLRLSLYWEDIASAKQIISSAVVDNIVQCPATNANTYTGINKLAGLPTGALMIRYEPHETAASARIALPRLAEAGDYKVYFVGSVYLEGAADVACSNGTTLPFKPSANNNAYNGGNHYGEANLYEVGDLSLLAGTDYTLTISLSHRMWVGIHAIYLVKTGEYSGEKAALDAPTVTVSSTGVASWEAVSNATGYEYSINGGAPIKTTETSVTLTEGQSIAVKALGEGAYADSEYSAAVTYVVGAATEWEFDLSNTASYKTGGSVSYADGYLYMPAGAANYIEFTVNAAKAGFYNISFIGKADVDRARIYHKNTMDKGDGWASHATSAQFAKGSVQSEYTYATNQYLYEGKNTIKIYVYEGEYSASMIRIALSFADPADVTHVVLSETNTETTKVNTQGGIGTNQFSSGATWVRVTDKVKFTLPKITEHGQYELYLLGSIYSSADTTFTLSDGRTFTYKPASLPNHYVEGNLYKLATLNLLADSYTLEATITGSWAGFHRFILVKVGEYPEALTVSSFSADPVAKTLSANGVFASPNYNRAVLAAYDKDGDVIKKVALDKTETLLTFTDLSLTMTDSEAAEFSYARVYAVDGEDNEVDDITPYEYASADTLTATAYTANASTGVFSAKIDFHSFSGKYATLALYNKAGAIVATTSIEKTGYSLVGETLSVTLDAATAATVASMQVFVTDEKNGTTVNTDYTSFRYTMEGELRLLFVSDLHYNVMRGASGMNNNLNGMDADQRAQHFVDAVLKENENAPITAVFLLGDLASAEDWYKKFDPAHASYAGKTNSTYDLDGNGTVNLDDYHGSKYDAIYLLNEIYLSQIEAAGIAVYCVPGNHDTVDNAYWEKIFGYKKTLGYTETEYIVKFPAQKTAVVMLNTFDKDKGSMTMSRNNDGKSYLAGTQQTLAFTPTDWELLKSFMDELVSEGYDTVYLAAHHFIGSEVYKKANEAYPEIKGYIYGDAHYDTVGNIYGVPSFIDGHYSQSLIEYAGTYGERIFDLPRLPFSWMMLEQKGLVATVDYYKEEALYLGKDNYEFLSQYFNLTEGTKNDHMIILTRVTNVDTSVAGQITETITAGYYNYTIRTDISAEDQALAARIAYQIETYDMDMFLLSKGNLGYIPEGYEVTTMTYTTTEGGPFKVSGTATGWCYMYLSSMPRYESFFKEKMNYKSYEIFAGKVTATYIDTEETTMTKDK